MTRAARHNFLWGETQRFRLCVGGRQGVDHRDISQGLSRRGSTRCVQSGRPSCTITDSRPWHSPGYLPHSVPQILINRTPINHINPDVSHVQLNPRELITDHGRWTPLQLILLGNADDIVQHLCLKLGWDLPLDPRQRGAPAQSVQAQAILGKRPSSSTNFSNEPEEVVGPMCQSRLVVRRGRRRKVVEGVRENSSTGTGNPGFEESGGLG